jgi:DNA invertase Pin-like site-specific DNA recombinase
MYDLKFAIYCRVEDADGKGMKIQKNELLRFAKYNDYGDPAFYCDSGQDEQTIGNPEMKRLIYDIRAGRIELVITRDIVRISPDPIIFCEWLELLNDYNVSFISVYDRIGLDGEGNMLRDFILCG